MTLDFDVTRHEVHLPGLPESLDGIQIIHLTDFHVGRGGAMPLARAVVDWTSAQSPDYIFLTGDYVDYSHRQAAPARDLLAGLRSKHGIFATMGNHDHRAGVGKVADALRDAGITVLDNESVQLSPGFRLAGVDDLDEGRGDVDKAITGIPPGSAVILLSHNPNALDMVPKDQPILVLAGHTHGGQIVLPFPTPGMICRIRLGTGYVSGWFRRGEARLYVNCGIGVTGRPPFNRRFRCPPEVAVFILRTQTSNCLEA